MDLLNIKKNIPSALVKHTHKHNPFWPLQSALDKAMGDFYGWFEPFNFPTERFENLSLIPAVDIVDDKDQFKIEVEMPGMSEEDVKASIDSGILTIKGEKTTSRQDKDKNYRMREISYGSYERNISLPDTVDVDKAKASFKKGMLWITLPKKPECAKKCRTIEVEKA
jgi:HSP20 family protein